MKSVRLKHYSLAIWLVVSLFVSAVSACTCSHHPERVEITEISSSSCHQNSREATQTSSSEQFQKSDSTGIVESLISQDQCCCIQPAPKVFAKSENLKIEKQTLAILPVSQIAIVFVPQTITIKSEFITPFYLTDSFYNLTPGRAPPIL